MQSTYFKSLPGILYSRFALVFVILLSIVTIVSSCVFNQENMEKEVVIQMNDNSLVGSSQCKSCHSEIYNQFLATTHKRTSMTANEENIMGSFESGENNYAFNYFDGVVMKDLDSGFYQVNFINREFVKAYRFDMVIGSGTRGQSYLYWNKNQLFQLPISYYTMADAWSNSPGYSDQAAYFRRSIKSQCMGCHSSYVDVISKDKQPIEEFNKENIVYGINCEKCHGAGGKHVNHFTLNPDAKGENFIVNAKHLSQQQQLDACAICHSSTSKDFIPALNFQTGNSLIHDSSKTNLLAKVDVHGNQYGLLVESACFMNSTKMTCTTCHNPHEEQRGNVAMFSQKCMQCHSVEKNNFCKLSGKVGVSTLQANCIDCHMPNRESQILNVKLDTEVENSPAVIRSHLIAVYPESPIKISQIYVRENLEKSGIGFGFLNEHF